MFIQQTHQSYSLYAAIQLMSSNFKASSLCKKKKKWKGSDGSCKSSALDRIRIRGVELDLACKQGGIFSHPDVASIPS